MAHLFSYSWQLNDVFTLHVGLKLFPPSYCFDTLPHIYILSILSTHTHTHTHTHTRARAHTHTHTHNCQSKVQLHHKESANVRIVGLSSADKYFNLPGSNAICTSKQVPMLYTRTMSPSSRKMSDSSLVKWRQRVPDETLTLNLPNYTASHPTSLHFNIHHC